MKSSNSVALSSLLIFAGAVLPIACKAQYAPVYAPVYYLDLLTGTASATVFVTPVKVGGMLRVPTIAYSISGTDSDAWHLQGNSAWVQLFDQCLGYDIVNISACGVNGSLHFNLRGQQGNTLTWDIVYGGKTKAGTYFDDYDILNWRNPFDVLCDPYFQITQTIIINEPNP